MFTGPYGMLRYHTIRRSEILFVRHMAAITSVRTDVGQLVFKDPARHFQLLVLGLHFPVAAETHLVIREMGKKRNGQISWGPVLESTTMEDKHSTTLTIFPVDGYERVVVALVPCIVDQGITPYKMEINAR